MTHFVISKPFQTFLALLVCQLALLPVSLAEDLDPLRDERVAVGEYTSGVSTDCRSASEVMTVMGAEEDFEL